MVSDLKGKAVLITGASTGIGAAAAQAFARCGSNVVVHYNASRDGGRGRRRRACARLGGAGGAGRRRRDQGGERRSASSAESLAAFGRIDVLINNAGGLVKRTRIEDYTEEFLDDVLKLNVTQVALFMREVIPLMRRQGGGQRHQRDLGRRAPRRRRRRDRLRRRQGLRLDGDPRLGEGSRRRQHPRQRGLAGRDHDAVPRALFDAEQLKGMQATIPMNRLGTADECAGTLRLPRVGRAERLRHRAGDRSQRRPVHAVSGAGGADTPSPRRQKNRGCPERTTP